LSTGAAGKVKGGDRLPWVADGAGPSANNFAPLQAIEWQVRVDGDVSSALRETRAARQLALHKFPWSRQGEQAGLQQNALYLIRPDGHIGLADP